MIRSGKPEIDELLSAYLDGQLSDRQHTEVKRLLRNDKEVSERLHQLSQQKQLLGLLPIETAPTGLLDSIQTSLERQFILQHDPQSGRSAAGARQLFVRRLLTAAAMLILPAGLLAVVVYMIMSPARSSAPTTKVDPGGAILTANLPTQGPLPRELPIPKTATVDTTFSPMSFTLILKTPEPIVVDSLLKKAIFNHALFNATVPNLWSYTITTSPESLIELMQDLRAAWPKCRETELVAFGRTVHSRQEVDRITPDQIVQLLQQPNAVSALALAKNFSGLNAFVAGVPSYGVTRTAPQEEWFVENPDMPVRPELAEPTRPVPAKPVDGPRATLHIVVEPR
ncbi:MAG: zf-HC2 domain-containing protein [Phycisphaerae bacterium]|nr:zf-HC2 domain-containing protein [Phycisphaerae bacterium]